jgi:N-acyl-D-amino-acid deacylase
MTVDLVLRGGTVHDGLGSPGRQADVVVSDGRIADVGRFEGVARDVVDCDGLVVAPGFIDPHAHSDLVHCAAEPATFKVEQGVTTEIVGNCGFSFAPMTAASIALVGEAWSELAGGQEVRVRDFAQYLDDVEQARPANNVAALVGHGTLRLAANGVEQTLRPGAVERMRVLAHEAFEAGAVGLSSGLIYVPGSYSDTDELIDVARVAAVHDRPYTTHMRDEADHLGAAVEEALTIGRRAGVRVQISHCKVAGRRNHGSSASLLGAIASARRDGVDVFGDQYPYTAGSTFLSALLPPAAHEGGVEALRERLSDASERAALRSTAESGDAGTGVWSQSEPGDVLIVAHREAGVVGRTLADIAGAEDAWERLCALVAADPGALCVIELMSEEDVRHIMADPLVAVGSDNGPPVGLQHPRTWGCFPRVLGTYVRELGVLTWEGAIRKMTSISARQFRLAGRGALLAGMVADVCVFDPQRIGHAGTYLRPDVAPQGVELVTLAGTAVLRSGAPTGERAGQVLRAGR